MLFVILFGMAVFVAVDAWQTRDRKRFGYAVVIATSCLLVAGYLTTAFPGQPGWASNKLQREFGPDWDCGSGVFCIRKPGLR
jgi:hypothetical protein